MTNNFNSKQQKTAKRYASALAKFEDRETILAELKEVSGVLVQSADLKSFLNNPIIKNQDKKDVLNQVFTNLSTHTRNFLMVLVDKNRFDCFDTILAIFMSEIDEINNVTRVKVISAVEMLEDEKARLQHKLQVKLYCDVVPEFNIDPSIIAGLVVKIGDKVIDNSVKAKFDGLKKQLI